MHFFKSFAVAAACSLASIAEAHILMASPVRATTPAATNGPLLADGSNYPCQLTSGQTLAGESTSMELGSQQPLNFIGQSVHGGGSCQVSITYDENPTKDSVWKTVTSIEGGCPAQNAEGNLGDDTSATAPVPYDYNFTLPDNIPSGKAVLAWTWFNKVGNREMYMNCALVELTGSSGDKSNYEALPDMFKANIDNGCSTVNDMDVTFPDPGANVQKLNGATSAFAAPAGSCATGSSSQPTGGSDSGSGSGASVTGGVGSSPTAPAASGGAVAPTAGGIFATVATTVPAAPAPTGSSSSGSGSSSGSSGSGSSSSGSSGSSGSESAGSACTTEGDYQCVSSTSYQICASGTWSAVMSVAAGTSCSGTGANFEIVAASGKFKMTRALRRAKRGLPFLG